jgi:hypothetical protein
MEMKTEIWKPIKDYEGLYEVSNYGRVRSVDRYIEAQCALSKSSQPVRYFRKGRILKVHLIGKTGYLGVMLSKGDVAKNFRVHRLVAEAFIPNPLNLQEVNHIDEDKINDLANNLEWCTRKQNENHGTKIERAARNRDRKPVEAYDENGNVVARFDRISDAARCYGVKICSIWGCCNHKGTAKRCKGLYWRYADQ